MWNFIRREQIYGCYASKLKEKDWDGPILTKAGSAKLFVVNRGCKTKGNNWDSQWIAISDHTIRNTGK